MSNFLTNNYVPLIKSCVHAPNFTKVFAESLTSRYLPKGGSQSDRQFGGLRSK